MVSFIAGGLGGWLIAKADTTAINAKATPVVEIPTRSQPPYDEEDYFNKSRDNIRKLHLDNVPWTFEDFPVSVLYVQNVQYEWFEELHKGTVSFDVYPHIRLPDGTSVQFYPDHRVEIYDKEGRKETVYEKRIDSYLQALTMVRGVTGLTLVTHIEVDSDNGSEVEYYEFVPHQP